MEAKDVIYTAGLFLTFALGVWNGIYTYRNTRRKSFIDTVTSERVKWITSIREDVARFCSLTHARSASGLSEAEGVEATREIERLRHHIRLQLNPNGDLDRQLERL